MGSNIVIQPRVLEKIDTFYYNMWQKYKHSWGEEEIVKLISDAYDEVYSIKSIVTHRNATKEGWKGLFMANFKNWYFAYKIDGDTIFVEDACHSQNMHEAILKVINLIERIDNLPYNN